MTEPRTREVNFGTFCKGCCFFEFVETEDPCNDCLNHPVNIDSERPLYFKQDPDKPDVLEAIKNSREG